MNNKKEARSSQQSSNYFPYPFFEKKRELSMYGTMFLQDFCTHFSIVLGKRNGHRNFYSVDPKDSHLNALLEYDNYMFMEYDFDKLLKSNLSDLVQYGKAYVEVVKLFDEDDKLVGIKLISFRNNFQIRINDKIYYLLRKYDGKLITGKIDVENVITFKVRDLGHTKGFFKRIFRKLRKFDFSFLELSMDSKSGFDFDVYKKKKDFDLLKVGNKLRWIGRKYDNHYINEPYLVYLRMEELKYKEKMLVKLLDMYNKKISEVGEKYGFTGKICFENRTSNYDELYIELESGMKNCEQVSNEIYC